MSNKSYFLIIKWIDHEIHVGKYVVETFPVPFLLNLSFNSLDVLWVSPSLPVSSLESCSSVTALLWVNSPISLDAGVLTIMAIMVITHTVTQAVEDLWLEMVQAWVLAC